MTIIEINRQNTCLYRRHFNNELNLLSINKIAIMIDCINKLNNFMIPWTDSLASSINI